MLSRIKKIKTWCKIIIFISFCTALYSCGSQPSQGIDLFDEWQFRVDSLDQGIGLDINSIKDLFVY